MKHSTSFQTAIYSILVIWGISTMLTNRVFSEEATADLEIALAENGLSFRMNSGSGAENWFLQYRNVNSDWEYLIKMELEASGKGLLQASIPWNLLPGSASEIGYFQVIQRENSSALLEEVLIEKRNWRNSELYNYRFKYLRQVSFFDVSGIVTVEDSLVKSFIPSPDIPPFFEGVAHSIDELFHEITSEIDRGAEIIRVEWHPIYRYPQSCFVDVSLAIADEEFGWQIADFEIDENETSGQ